MCLTPGSVNVRTYLCACVYQFFFFCARRAIQRAISSSVNVRTYLCACVCDCLQKRAKQRGRAGERKRERGREGGREIEREKAPAVTEPSTNHCKQPGSHATQWRLHSPVYQCNRAGERLHRSTTISSLLTYVKAIARTRIRMCMYKYRSAVYLRSISGLSEVHLRSIWGLSGLSEVYLGSISGLSQVTSTRQH